MAEVNLSPEVIKPKLQLKVETQQLNDSHGECYPLFLGGSSLADGKTQSSLKPMSCAKLRCSACDKKIVRFNGDVKWSGTVDYIFVRNYNTLP